MKKMMLGLAVLLGGCLGYPDTVKPVNNFDLDRYLGKWYEIARFDHSFERGLESVTAEYSLKDGGGVVVKNRGYSVEDKEWSESVGKAYFVENKSTGYLKVSFFGPFYGSYVVFELDQKDYKYAFVASSSHSYIWFLSRTPTVPKELKNKFKESIKSKGFNPDNLRQV